MLKPCRFISTPGGQRDHYWYLERREVVTGTFRKWVFLEEQAKHIHLHRMYLRVDLCAGQVARYTLVDRDVNEVMNLFHQRSHYTCGLRVADRISRRFPVAILIV